MEQFKPIKYYKGHYEVSSLGYIISLKNGERNILKSVGVGKQREYQRVMLYKNGKTKQKFVHRLVAESFIPNQEKKSEVNHKDGNKLNNNVENLERMTHDENIEHARVNGLYSKPRLGKFGKYNHSSLQIEMLNMDGLVINEYYGFKEAYRETGIAFQNINKCCKGKKHTVGGYKRRYKTIE